MGILVRAIVTGFGLSLGAAIYKRVEKRLGLDPNEPGARPAEPPSGDGGAIPGTPITPVEPTLA